MTEPSTLSARAGAAATLQRLVASPTIRASGVYVASNLLNRAVPFLLLPILTRFLSPAEFGLVTMFTMVVTLALPLTGLNTDGAIAREYFDRSDTFPRYVTTCIALLVVSLLATMLLVAALSGPLTGATRLPFRWLGAAILVAGGRFVTQVVLTMWQVRQRPWSYAAYHFAQTVLVASLAVVLVVQLRLGWPGRVLADVIGVTSVSVVGLLILYRAGWLGGGLSMSDARRALAFGAGLLPHVYGAALLAGVTDRLFITHLVGLDAMGMYAAAAQVAMVITVLEHSVNQAWIPWLYARLTRNRPEDHATIRRVATWYCVALLLVAIAFGLLAPPLLDWFLGDRFAGAGGFLFWLALGAAFGGMYKTVVNQIFFLRRTLLLAGITCGVGVLNVFVTWALTERHGAIGAAEALAVSHLLLFIATGLVSRHLMKGWRASRATQAGGS